MLRCVRRLSSLTLSVCVQSRFAHLLIERVKRHGVACVALRGGEGEGRERGHWLLSQPAPRDWRPTKIPKAFEKTGSTVSRLKVSVSLVGRKSRAMASRAHISDRRWRRKPALAERGPLDRSSQLLRPRGQAANSTREIAIAMARPRCEGGLGAAQLHAAWASRSIDRLRCWECKRGGESMRFVCDI